MKNMRKTKKMITKNMKDREDEKEEYKKTEKMKTKNIKDGEDEKE